MKKYFSSRFHDKPMPFIEFKHSRSKIPYVEKGRYFTKILTLVLVFSLLLGSIGFCHSFISSGESPEKTEMVLARGVEGSGNISSEEGVERVVDEYGSYALIEIVESDYNRLEEIYDIDRLEDRNELTINSHNFNTAEKRLDEPPTFEKNEKGLFIVDMVAPVNPEWREKLESLNVEVISYQPNYAYEVRTTAEKAEQIEEFEFVDSVLIYPPSLKMRDDIGAGSVEIDVFHEDRYEIFKEMEELTEVSAIETSTGNHHRVIAEVEEEELDSIARNKDVYRIRQTSSKESVLHSEIDSQLVGGGAWFMDDHSDPVEGPWREGYPSDPYRKYGDHGAYVNQLGYTGKNVTIAIADSGIGNGTVGDVGHPDFGERVVGGYDFGRDTEAEGSWKDQLGHGTHVAGSAAGNTYEGTGATYEGHAPYYLSQGLAYDSELYSVKVFDIDDDGDPEWVGPGIQLWPPWSIFPGPEDHFEIIEEAAERSDAYIHTNSWGIEAIDGEERYLGQYLERAKGYDEAVRDATDYGEISEDDPMVVITAAGNAGPGYGSVADPGTAKNTITVGSTHSYAPDATSYQEDATRFLTDLESPETVSETSSRGWTSDNRVKPDLVAPGYGILSTRSPETEMIPPHGLYSEDNRYDWRSGTSMAAPRVAGAAAVVVEWYEENFGEKPSPAMVKALMINTAEGLDPEMGNTIYTPNRKEGWGILNLPDLIDPSVNIETFDQRTTLKTGESREHEMTVDDTERPLNVTLTWTDAPGEIGDDRVLKNDLNLFVESPTGEIYTGNAFDLTGDGESDSGYTYPNADTMDPFDTNEDGLDDVNNVQNVFIPADEVEEGMYTVRVSANQVVEDGNKDGGISQDYSLVKHNAVEEITPPELGVVDQKQDGIRYVMEDLGYNYTLLNLSDIEEYDDIKGFDALFINQLGSTEEGVKKSLEEFVDRGKFLYTSGVGSELLEGNLSGYIDFVEVEKEFQSFQSDIVESGLHQYLQEDSIDLQFEPERNITGISDDVATYMKVGETPLVVGFDHGHGRVVYSSFYSTADDDMQKAALEYFIELGRSWELAKENIRRIEHAGFDMEKDLRGSTDPGEVHEYTFEVEEDREYKIMFNWPGSEVNFKIERPNGSIYYESDSDLPPLSVELIEEEPGEYICVVEVQEVTFSGLPFAVSIGSREPDEPLPELGPYVLITAVVVVAVFYLLVIGIPTLIKKKEKDDPYRCPECDTRLQYISEYDRWYCGRCRRYH